MSFGVDSTQLNTCPGSKELTRNVTPEHFKQQRDDNPVTSQSKCISQYKSNQKDSKIPDYQVHFQYLEMNKIDTSRTMDLEDLVLQGKKDSAHHQS